MTPTDSSKAAESTERERALAPYLEQLAAACADDSGSASTIVLGEQDFELEPWQRETLRLFADGRDAEGHPWPSLVHEGLAFAAKCRSDDHEDEDEENAGSTEERILATAAGAAILGELQTCIDQFLRSGRMKQVKRLTELRNRVHQGVIGMRRRVDPEARAVIETKAAEMTVQRAAAIPIPAGGEPERRKPTPTQYKKDAAPVRVVHREPEKSRILRPLLVVLIISAATWIGLLVTQNRHVGPAELTLEAFRDVPVVRSIEARPPSLYVSLGHGWTELSSADRLRSIGEIAIVAERAGYIGVQLWTANGVAAGRWSKKHGAQLIDEPTGSS